MGHKRWVWDKFHVRNVVPFLKRMVRDSYTLLATSSHPLSSLSLMQFQANINQFREPHWPKKITTFYKVIILILTFQVGILMDNISAMPRAKDHPLSSTSKSSWASHQTLVQVSLFGILHATTQTGWESDTDTSREQKAFKQTPGTWPSPGEVGRAEGTCSAAHSWEWLWRDMVNGAEKKPWRQLHRNETKEGTECCKCDIEGYSETYKIGAGWKLKAEGAQTFEKMGIYSRQLKGQGGKDCDRSHKLRLLASIRKNKLLCYTKGPCCQKAIGVGKGVSWEIILSQFPDVEPWCRISHVGSLPRSA